MQLIRQQLYKSQQQEVRYKKRIATLTTILRALKQKNLLSLEELDIVENFSELNKTLLNGQIRKTKKLRIPRLYAPELRRFALTLHYYSPRAYNYVRKQLNNCLPHAKTLSTWYTSVEGEPGINSAALEMIKRHVKNASYQLIGTLMFDEMAIRQHLEYSSDVTYGHVDFGQNVENDILLAREALVFCVVCINVNWKIPIAYYLINGITHYIQSLQLQLSSNESVKLLDLKKLGFLGFLISIQSLLTSFEEICQKEYILTYIPTYKFSQDHIEMLFSVIRSHGGYNNNPTVKQFKSAFRKILIHDELSTPSTGNCIPLEEIPILNVSSKKNNRCS
ncbi:THAP domain-containing protein [Ooceraea biroi]|uniref:THAP domain-containing protein n=1 Tax=Ooceraea biroi TaxID=2015173 RepID=A0A026WUM2_OOCBI|nr:THAP domain-containing protein [Ooceraea biroi]